MEQGPVTDSCGKDSADIIGLLGASAGEQGSMIWNT